MCIGSPWSFLGMADRIPVVPLFIDAIACFDGTQDEWQFLQAFFIPFVLSGVEGRTGSFSLRTT